MKMGRPKKSTNIILRDVHSEKEERPTRRERQVYTTERTEYVNIIRERRQNIRRVQDGHTNEKRHRGNKITKREKEKVKEKDQMVKMVEMVEMVRRRHLSSPTDGKEPRYPVALEFCSQGSEKILRKSISSSLPKDLSEKKNGQEDTDDVEIKRKKARQLTKRGE